MEPRKRGIGYVPQDYALFPHYTVEKNIGFGIKNNKVSKSYIDDQVKIKASLLGIDHLLGRSIKGLSGGEKQRVALARALCIEPRVLLLDEPVSALDESTRESVCAQLRELQKELGITTIHVSHNLEEAFSVADRGAVLHNGIFRQTGTLDILLRKPSSEFVARFMRCSNIFKGKTGAYFSDRDMTEVFVGEVLFTLPGNCEGEVCFTIRPENIFLEKEIEQSKKELYVSLSLKVKRVVDRGAYVRIDCTGAVSLTAHVPYNHFSQQNISGTDTVRASFAIADIHIIPDSGESSDR